MSLSPRVKRSDGFQSRREKKKSHRRRRNTSMPRLSAINWSFSWRPTSSPVTGF
nr:MAG TPA: hypothetical protein [Caudoviricetes sp.]